MRSSVQRVVVVLGVVAMACVSMKTLRGSSGVFLTPAGARVTVNRPSAFLTQKLQELFVERGFPMVNRAQTANGGVVLFFRGPRTLVTAENNTGDAVWGLNGQLGSWFAVRVTEDQGRSTVVFYGKPTVRGQEVCAEQDDQLRDVAYSCSDVRVREDWPGSQLVEGREETEVITGVIATITERLPER